MAMLRPIPLPAPVTRAVLLESSKLDMDLPIYVSISTQIGNCTDLVERHIYVDQYKKRNAWLNEDVREILTARKRWIGR
jgi:hypothetical protein